MTFLNLKKNFVRIIVISVMKIIIELIIFVNKSWNRLRLFYLVCPWIIKYYINNTNIYLRLCPLDRMDTIDDVMWLKVIMTYPKCPKSVRLQAHRQGIQLRYCDAILLFLLNGLSIKKYYSIRNRSSSVLSYKIFAL